jgi:hypothetical protein
MNFKNSLYVFLFLIIPSLSRKPNSSTERILLEDINILTFYKGEFTTGRRLRPIPQLNCVGGEGCKLFEPEFVYCENAGFDGSGTLLTRY